MPSIAIVTGASSGLGRELVRRIDRGEAGAVDEIWAVGRRAERLEALGRDCQATVRPFALDLTDPASFDAIERAVVETEADIRLLVNDAGFGAAGDFACQGRDQAPRMIELLARAPVELTYRALPHMRAGARILNVASVAAFAPQPRLAVYAACKRFVLDFSRALDAELGDVDIHATALCPKFMETEFLDRAGDAEAMRRLCAIGFEDVGDVADAAIRATVAGRALCIPSPDMRAYYAAAKLLPYPLLVKAERLLGII